MIYFISYLQHIFLQIAYFSITNYIFHFTILFIISTIFFINSLFLLHMFLYILLFN